MGKVEDSAVVEMPVVVEVVISQQQLVYSSEQNDFYPAISFVLICSDGREYQYAMAPDLAYTVFQINNN